MENFKPHFVKITGFLLAFFLHFLFLNQTVLAQWTKTQGPPGINVNVYFNNGSLLFAGTSSKGVFKSSDHGATWMAANTGLKNASVFSFTKDQTYLYAGTDKGVYRSSNNGVSWSAANIGIQTQFVNSMVIGGGFLFAGTVGNGVFRSSDKGNTWADANGGALGSSLIFAMCFVKNKLIVEADNFLFYSTDAGNSWFVDQGSTAFFVIKHFFVLGDTILASARNGVFHSYNGGASWSNFLPVEPDDLTDLLGFSFSNSIIYTGDKNGMFQSANFGKSWTAISASGLRSNNPFRFNNYFIKSGNSFVIGMDELGVMRSVDNGNTWNQSISGFAVGSTIDNCLLNINDTIFSGTHSDGVYNTINNGNAWNKIGTKLNTDTLSNAIVFALLNPAPNIILAGTAGDGLYRSADNGKTWKHITAGLPFKQFGNFEGDNGLVKSGSNTLLATSTGIYYSTNNGLTWKASNLAGDRIDILSIAANGSVAVAGVSQGVPPFQSGIYRSTNKGVTWSLVTQVVQDAISLAGDGATNFYAGTFSDNWRSTNNGVSWSNIVTGIPVNTGGFTIKVIGTNNVFIGNNKGIYFSNNKGNSFTNVSTGLDPAPNNSVQGLEANSTYLFAGLFKNGVWRRLLSDFGITPSFTGVSSKVNTLTLEVSSKNKLSIYPNPAADQATIHYETNVSEEVQLKITDQLGKAIFYSNKLLASGVYTTTIDVKRFSPGTYYVQLIANGKTNTAKLIVTR